jgi:uroporphyrinogen decarboxylase
MMSPRERCLAAIHLEEPDRVPCFELGVNLATVEKLINRPTVSAALGCMTSEELRTMARDTVEAYATAGLDMVPASAGFPENYRDGFVPERINPNRWIDEFGRIWEDRSGVTGLSWYIGGTVKSRDDLDRIREIDPDDAGRTSLAEEIVKSAREKEMAVAGYVDGPFLTAYMTVGLSDFLVKIYRDRSFSVELLELVTRFNCAQAKKLAELDVDTIIVGDDMADSHGPLINPRDLKNIMFPFLAREIAAIKRTGTPVVIHSDGNTMPVFDDIVALGIDGYQAIEPDAGMDIAYIKERYGDNLCLLGNVDCGNTLTHGSPRQVEAEAKHVIESAASGGGLILGSSNSIHDGVKLENFLTMIRRGEKFGKYLLS